MTTAHEMRVEQPKRGWQDRQIREHLENAVAEFRRAMHVEGDLVLVVPTPQWKGFLQWQADALNLGIEIGRTPKGMFRMCSLEEPCG